jgi:hypothetical protein
MLPRRRRLMLGSPALKKIPGGIMRHLMSIASAASLCLLLSGAAFAQQPPANAPAGGTPDAMPFDIPYGMSISGEKAKQVLAAAEAEAKNAIGK